MVSSPSTLKYQPVSTATYDYADTYNGGKPERRQRGGRQNTGRRHNRELLLRMRDAQLDCPNPLGWGAKHFPSGTTPKAAVAEEKASMLLSPMATTPPPRASDNFSPGTGEKDFKENESQTGGAFKVIREALGLNPNMEGKPNGARIALTSLENFNSSAVHTDPAVVAAQQNAVGLDQNLEQESDASQVSTIQQPITNPPKYRAPEVFPVVVPPPLLPIAPAPPKPTLTDLDPELCAPQSSTTTNLGHIELSNCMPPTLPSPVGSLAELSSIASVSEISTPMAWTKDEVAVEDSWSTLQATLGMGPPVSARTPTNRFEASLLAATSAATAAQPSPVAPVQQTPWWGAPQQSPPIHLGYQQFLPPMQAQTQLPPTPHAMFNPTGINAGFPAQPTAWPVGGWGDSMEGHKAALAAAVQASGLESLAHAMQAQAVPVEVPVESEPGAQIGTSPHKAAYRRPTDDEITAKLQALQNKPEQPRVDLLSKITDQDIVDRLLKVKMAAQTSPVPQETTMQAGPAEGTPTSSEGQRIRI